MRAIGLMSGTSLDGVDAAWIETDGERVLRRGASESTPYPPALRADLRRLLDRAPTLPRDDPEVAGIARRVTEAHVAAVRALGMEADIVGFHGQTVLHRPEQRITWQIGDAAALAREVGMPVAHDFRSADVAAGGEGAPFAPAYHAALAAGLPRPLAVLNLGGVANVTWIGPDDELLAFDTGPGNGPLDDWTERPHRCRVRPRRAPLRRRPRRCGRARPAARGPIFRPARPEIARPARFRPWPRHQRA